MKNRWSYLISPAMDAVFLLMELLKDPELWKECCLKHDIAYWQGGTEEDRSRQTSLLKHVLKKKQVIPLLRI
jgi:hypothetical protein